MNFFSYFLSYLAAFFRWLFYLPLSFFSVPRRLLGLSLPARAALAGAVVLTTASLIVIFVVWAKQPQRGDWSAFIPGVVVIVILLLIIPWVIYYAVKFWLEGDVSGFPDVERAWNEGTAELAAQGIDIRNTPLFLIVGPQGDAQIRNLMALADIKFSVFGKPANQPLSFFATRDEIFLVCPGVSQIAELLKRADSGVRDEAPLENFSGTIVAGAQRDPRGTELASPLTATVRATPLAKRAEEEDEPQSGTWLRGTMEVGSGTVVGGAAAAQRRVADVVLPTESARDMEAKLDFVCRLIVRARQPVCPINGILAVLPFDLIEQGAGIAVKQALHQDLRVLRRALRLQCPALALVARMETETGFLKLVQRVGTKKAREQRFGKGFNVQSVPEPEPLESFTAHACGAFEDWIYELFRQPEGLSDPGNSKLYRLLGKIRRLRSRFDLLLQDGFAHKASAEAGTFLRFGGCYFAATGDRPENQAFVKSVFEKLLDSQGDLEWMPSALQEDNRNHALARTLLVVDGLLFMFFCGLMLRWLLSGR